MPIRRSPLSAGRGCCTGAGCSACPGSGVTRRGLLAVPGAALAAASAGRLSGAASPAARTPGRFPPIKNSLRVQPVLVYAIPKKRDASSWRSWGGLLTEQDAAQEKSRIRTELAALRESAEFPLEILPLASVQTPEQAAAVAAGGHDTLILYGASGGVKLYEELTNPGKYNIMFVRHRSGPVYLWYEIAHARYLRKTVDEFGQPGMDHRDVVVDSYAEMLWRLRALYGLKNTLGKRIVAVGGPSGWGAGGKRAPEVARECWKLDIRSVTYPELGERIRKAREDQALSARCREEAAKYLKQDSVSLETPREFVMKAFLLTEVFRDLLDEHQTDAFTINNCMSTIMPASETTACLPLSLLNDEGYMAFCESDFVVIPSGILLHYISGKPVFLNDPTYPHDNVVTLAHCTAPRRMDGKNLEPVRLLTHFESDYGAAPKVEMRKGAAITNLIPDFSNRKWVGFEGEIAGNPFMPICRSQIDVAFKGDCDLLNAQTGGFHWMSCYGSYVKESGYALKKIGVQLAAV